MTGLEHYKPRKWLSITALHDASRCPRRYFYAKGCRLEPAGGSHAALDFGKQMHLACQTFLSTGDVNKAYAAFMSVWDDSKGDPKRNSNTAKLILIDFATVHSGNNSIIQLQPPPDTGITIERQSPFEVPFAVDIGLRGADGQEIPLVGLIDGTVMHRDTREHWAWELKTTSEMSARFLTGFEMNPQAFGYPTVLNILTGHRKYMGTFVEGLQVAKTKVATGIQPILVTEHQSNLFLQWARYWGNMMLACEKEGEFPQNIAACTPYVYHYTPGFMCDYKHLCSVPDWTQLKSFYTEKEERPFVLAEAKETALPQGAVEELRKEPVGQT